MKTYIAPLYLYRRTSIARVLPATQEHVLFGAVALPVGGSVRCITTVRVRTRNRQFSRRYAD
jgi:hypothetical protein